MKSLLDCFFYLISKFHNFVKNFSLKRKKVIVTVINDLVTDQRVKRVCDSLYYEGFDILLVGRCLPDSLKMDERNYKSFRFKMFFKSGPLFYVFYNIRLFFFLLFTRFDIAHANDLDTLLAVFLASKFKKKKVVYDSHELFTEVPELINRPFVRKIWLSIESFILPKLDSMFTVNDSIAKIYADKYKINTIVLRNMPTELKEEIFVKKSDFGFDEETRLVILQGAGINVDRGAEEAVEAMNYIENCILIIAGSGDVVPRLKSYVLENNLNKKVVFFDKMPHDKLFQLTKICDCGLTLDKDTNLNYRFSLPNKLFDYIRAGIPIISSDLPELRKIIDNYNIGLILETHEINEVANKINKILFEIPRSEWTDGLRKASHDLRWENEQSKLLNYYEQFKR